MMYKTLRNLIFLLLITSMAFAQTKQKIETDGSKRPYGISGTPILNSPETMEMLKKYGNNSYLNKGTKGVGDVVGGIKTFFVSNIETDVFDEVSFKLMAQGNVAQVWCAVDELSNGHLTQDVADSVLLYLESKSGKSSVDPLKGVIAIDQEYFGNPPDKDSDGLADAFLCDIKDGWDPDTGGGYVAGFFYSVDQYDDPGDGGSFRSNERDIIYIDSYPGIFYNGEASVMGGITTTSHEYQHLIHFNYDQNEYTVVNEGLSENAEYINGLYTRSAYGYLSNVNVPIFKWDRDGDVLSDYSRASLFYNYIGDRFGLENFKYHTQSVSAGKTGILEALSNSGYSEVTFEELIHDFHIANIVNDRTLDARYGYLNEARQSIWIPEHDAHKILLTAGDGDSYSLQQGGAGYLTFDNIDVQEAVFTFDENIRVTAVKVEKYGTISIESLTSGVQFDVAYSGEAYDYVYYIMTNVNSSPNGSITTGTVDVSWVINGAKSFYLHSLNTYSETPKFFWMIPYYNSSNVGRLGFTNEYEMPETGELSQLKLYLVSGIDADDNEIEVRGEGQLRYAVYTDVASNPGVVVAEDTISIDLLVSDWNTFDISSWGLTFNEGDNFHIVYELIVPTVDQDINSIPLRLDDGRGSQNVTNIVTAPGEFQTIFSDDDTGGQHGVWNEFVYKTYGIEAPVNLSATFKDESVFLEWSPTLAPGFSKYLIYGGTETNPQTVLAEINEASTDSVTITGLENGKEYFFSMTIVDNNQDETSRSNESSAIPLSFALAELQIGVLQNPVFTEEIDIYIASNVIIDPTSISANISINDNSSSLSLSNMESKVFQNTQFTMTESGTIQINSRAKNENAAYFGYDTLNFSTQLLKVGENTKIASADQKLSLSVEGHSITEKYWFTVIPEKPDFTQSIIEYEILDEKGYGLGLENKAVSGALNWAVDEQDNTHLFIATIKNGELYILPTRYNRVTSSLSTVIESSGTYFLVKSLNGVENIDVNLPEYFDLAQNYPNPFNPQTSLRFSLPESDVVSLVIYNTLGQKIRTLMSGNLSAGSYEYLWNGQNEKGESVASGIYFYQLRGQKYQDVKKMVLAR